MINTGVIGVGYWGPNWVRNFAMHPEVRVKTVCDLKEDRLQYIRRMYPFLQTTTCYQDVLNDTEIDLVAVCTPVDSHFELAQAVLQSGKHVLLEKPMTASVEQAEALLKIAGEKNRHIFVDHTFIFTGAVRKIRELLESGEIGELYYFDSVRVNLGLFQHDVNVIWDLAPHDIAIMHYLLEQPPISVVATGADHLGQGLEDVAYLTVYYPGSLIAHIHTNWLSPVKIRQTLLAGSRKMVVWDDNQPSEKVRVYDKGIEVVRSTDEIYNTLIQYRTGDMHCPKIDATEALAAETRHIVNCLKGTETPLVDGRAGLMVVRILEAAQQSIKQRGREIRIND
ncbi:MAG: Gfo/Idh/MocA family oxidoreductase [Calditrichia bacterium]